MLQFGGTGDLITRKLKVEIDTWWWAGVPCYLRTGKRLPDRLSELVVTFDGVPHSIDCGQLGSGRRELIDRTRRICVA
jgi:glucose-6-phosphate 1-dehydrogenase